MCENLESIIKFFSYISFFFFISLFFLEVSLYSFFISYFFACLLAAAVAKSSRNKKKNIYGRIIRKKEWKASLMMQAFFSNNISCSCTYSSVLSPQNSNLKLFTRSKQLFQSVTIFNEFFADFCVLYLDICFSNFTQIPANVHFPRTHDDDDENVK